MSKKKWSIGLLIAVGATLVLFGGIMFLLDPVLNYGKEKAQIPYYEYSTLYTNPGIARHYTYDAVLVGTSMIQNTDVDLCEELLDCEMVRLPYSGGTSYDMKTILEVCFSSDNDIKAVYWELDQFQLTGSATEHRYPVPEYLYNNQKKDDLSYLLNLDVMYHYGLNNVLGSLQGQVSDAERRGITLTGNFDGEVVLAEYVRPEVVDEIQVFEGSALESKVDANLQNIFSVIEANPETEFVFFMPPFSVLYWDRELRNGTFEASMDATEYALKQLLTYENVAVYFYQAEEDIITNLDNYKDYSHYGNWINDRITQYIAEGKNRVTQDNCEVIMQEMKNLMYGYDFEAVFK